METIYLSLRAQVAVGTFFMKSPVLYLNKIMPHSLSELILDYVIFQKSCIDFAINARPLERYMPEVGEDRFQHSEFVYSFLQI